MGDRIKIGILIFSNKQKERSKDNSWDSKKNFGIRAILKEIDRDKYDIEFTAAHNIWKYFYVLVSITSYYDILNLQNENIVKGECKIIVGGAGISNPDIISHIADIIIVGRGEGLINDLLEGKRHPDVEIRQPKYLLKLGNWKEQEVGCKKKCFFCQYSWKFEKPKSDGYESGFNNKEDFFTYHNWDNKNAVSAIDGLTETTRKIINKNITNEQIINKIRETENYKDDLKIKIYMILGFPWEKESDFNELYNVLNEADYSSSKRLKIWFNSTHFVPMPFTPMQNEAINETNFREIVLKNYWVRSFFNGNTIEASFMPHFSTPEAAFIQTIINRGKSNDLIRLNKILKHSKYKQLKYSKKIEVLKREFGKEMFGKVNLKNKVQTPYNVEKAIAAYEKRKQSYLELV